MKSEFQNMKNIDPENLLQKYHAGKSSRREGKFCDYFFLLKESTYLSLIEGGLRDSSDTIDLKVFDRVTNPIAPSLPVLKNNWPIKIILAAAALMVVFGIWTVLFTNNNGLPSYSSDINPGGNKARLTLQNGKNIELSEDKNGIIIDASKITYNDGTVVNSETSRTFTIATPNGGSYQVVLPDGTKVWLNAASSLSYSPANKELSYRNVNLSGEAYFEVFKDSKHPFIVSTKHQRIEVLGTHFNVSAYHDDLSIKTTLLEGSVKVAPLSGLGTIEKGVTLIPKQQAILTDNKLQVRKVKIDDAISWKNGDFSFSKEKLENIMKKISRWYNVEIVYDDENIKEKNFSGSISKFGKASMVLYMLEKTGEVHFEVEEGRIIVMK